MFESRNSLISAINTNNKKLSWSWQSRAYVDRTDALSFCRLNDYQPPQPVQSAAGWS